LRIERQALIGFPAHAGALFTIRTYFTPIAAVAENPERRRALASAIAGMTEAQLAYKGLTRLREPLLAYLAEV
ncbi:MAG: heme-dependent oxidative N-demethylase subunit alpha family protein, partial [Candidatus Sericytochromatia bacterium]